MSLREEKLQKNLQQNRDTQVLCCKKKEILPFATAWMGLEIIILGKTSQSEKDK